ncbi:hypothetical protein [Roseateles sp.]|uniref:hypothetical protein n=1 Tax=Roseateles sp. TaxID=1971397 RepID=UPI003BA65B41
MPKFTVNIPVETDAPKVVVDVNPQSPMAAGRHRFSLVVVDDSGNESAPDTIDLIVADRDRPTAVLQGPEIASVGKEFTLNGAKSFDTGGGTIKTWRFTYLGPSIR